MMCMEWHCFFCNCFAVCALVYVCVSFSSCGFIYCVIEICLVMLFCCVDSKGSVGEFESVG